jgi:hypothetical protein
MYLDQVEISHKDETLSWDGWSLVPCNTTFGPLSNTWTYLSAFHCVMDVTQLPIHILNSELEPFFYDAQIQTYKHASYIMHTNITYVSTHMHCELINPHMCRGDPGHHLECRGHSWVESGGEEKMWGPRHVLLRSRYYMNKIEANVRGEITHLEPWNKDPCFNQKPKTR